MRSGFVFLALLLLVATACNQNPDSAQTQHPTRVAEAEATGDEGLPDGGTTPSARVATVAAATATARPTVTATAGPAVVATATSVTTSAVPGPTFTLPPATAVVALGADAVAGNVWWIWVRRDG